MRIRSSNQSNGNRLYVVDSIPAMLHATSSYPMGEVGIWERVLRRDVCLCLVSRGY